MGDEPLQALLKDPPVAYAVSNRGVLILARVVDWDGNLLTQAACTGISYVVYDESDNDTPVGSDTLTVSAVVFNTAQTGGNWPYSDGYNFKWMMPATLVPTKGHLYRVEITVDPVSGEDFNIGGSGMRISAK